jgi:thiamine-phosphate pyrophosphorylase
LERFLICYITDRGAIKPEPLERRIGSAILAGVDWIQIREKDLPTRDLLRLAASAVEQARGAETQILVNDRLDVALAAGAEGVHLGRSSMPAAAVRSCVPESFRVGVSCHSVEEAVRAESAGASYVVFGPVFATPSKLSYGPPLGLGKLEEAAARVKIPVLALGGITLDRVRPCRAHGAAGIAAIRLFQEGDSLEDRVRELRRIVRTETKP